MQTDQIAKLNDESYSKITDYYRSLTKPMTETRSDVLSFVLNGLNSEKVQPTFIGPARINGPTIAPLPKESRILDVGCANGDNLILMHEHGFNKLAGLDVATGMIEEAVKQLTHAKFFCCDFFEFSSPQKFDLVFAQAFVHLFPKAMLKTVLLRLLSLSNRRVYFSTTMETTPSEGIEPKGEVVRYRSRYTPNEIIATAREMLAEDPNLSFHYFSLTDALGKKWINCVVERQDTAALFKEEGVIVYKKFFEPEKVKALLPELDHLKDTVPPPGTLLRYDTKDVFDRVENFMPHCSSDMRNLLDNPKVDLLVSKLMGEDAALLKDKINYKMPGAGQFVAHQDAAAGWGRYGENQITMSVSFDPANEKNGGLYFATNANKEGLLAPVCSPLSEETSNSLYWDLVSMEPGDALFFDAYAPHLSNPNTSDKPRRMALLTYNAKRLGDLRAGFFADKRKRQPPIDERPANGTLERDVFGKIVFKENMS